MPLKYTILISPAKLLSWSTGGCRMTKLSMAFWLLSSQTFGQSTAVATIPGQLAAYTQQQLTEKLFLHLDQPCYVSGDILWFKVYAAHATTHQPLDLSKVAYVELLDQQQKPVLQSKIGLRQAAGQGSLLLPESLPSGMYTLRAYTSWMKNGAPDFYFHRAITVFNTFQPLGGSALRAETRFDAQFFPEGGSLVAGANCRVAFKITDETGRGVQAAGVIRNQQGLPVAQFKTLRFGMGSFDFTPVSVGEQYTASIQLPNNRTLSATLPPVTTTGYALRLTAATPETLQLTVTTGEAGAPSEPVFLLGHTRQQTHQFVQTTFQNGRATFTLPKEGIPEGITQFTVFDAKRRPLAERLYFRPPVQQRLALAATPDRSTYGPRQKVTVRLTSTTSAGQPTAANTSFTVHRLDSLASVSEPTIAGSFWLTSDLKGTVEQPEYYLSTSAEATAAADNLMLTQGWRRFRWQDVLTDKAPDAPFPPEVNGHIIRGRVTDQRTQSPAAGITTYLSLPSRQIRLYVAQSTADGHVEFEVPAQYGLRDVVLQPYSSTDSTYRAALLSPYSLSFASVQWPTIAWRNALLPDLTQRHIQTQVSQAYFPDRHRRYVSHTADSLAFYGQPSERYFLDKYTRFKTMEEVLREYVPGVQVRTRKGGFHLQVLDKVNGTVFADNPLVLLDGVPIFDMNKVLALDPLRIRQLDVVTSNYVVGPLVARGVVSFTTYKGNLDGLQLPARALLQEYEALQWEREFYAPRYDTPQAQRSPLADLRQVLHWQPTVYTDANGQALVDFFTSDKAGRYQIEVQGTTPTGLVGATTVTFEVKQTI